ncbi:hypothetical protein BANRA_05463 [Klebsiella pneumoniae]|nr:hypothetical protein BANRA_05463 [Klebsiella pneumoniae]
MFTGSKQSLTDDDFSKSCTAAKNGPFLQTAVEETHYRDLRWSVGKRYSRALLLKSLHKDERVIILEDVHEVTVDHVEAVYMMYGDGKIGRVSSLMPCEPVCVDTGPSS